MSEESDPPPARVALVGLEAEEIMQLARHAARDANSAARDARLAATKAMAAVDHSLEAYQAIWKIGASVAKLETDHKLTREDIAVIRSEMREGFDRLAGSVREQARSLTDLQESQVQEVAALQEQDDDPTIVRGVKAQARDEVATKLREADQRIKELELAKKAQEEDARAKKEAAQKSIDGWKGAFTGAVAAAIVGAVVTALHYSWDWLGHHVFH